ncbi:MAG: hypothetical protein WB770_10800 [Acidimicrobiales bacterium]
MLVSLVLGAVPALRAFWTIAVLLAAALTVYLFLLARFAATASDQQRGWYGDETRVPEEWVNASITDSAGQRDCSRMPWVRLIVEERSA